MSDPTLSRMLEDQRREFDFERRRQLVYDIQHYLLDNVVARCNPARPAPAAPAARRPRAPLRSSRRPGLEPGLQLLGDQAYACRAEAAAASVSGRVPYWHTSCASTKVEFMAATNTSRMLLAPSLLMSRAGCAC